MSETFKADMKKGAGRVRAVRTGSDHGDSWWLWKEPTGGRRVHVATLTAEQWESYGKQMVRAYAQGKPFQAPKQTALSPKRREEILEHGRDATREVDAWDREQAASEAREDGAFRETLSRYPSEQWPALCRELFASLHDSPRELPASERATGSEWIDQILEQAEDLPAWERLRQRSRNDAWAAGVGASQAARQLSDALDEQLRNLPEQDPQRLEDEAEDAEELEPERAAELKEKADEQAALAAQVDLELGAKDSKIRKALSQAATEAVEELEGEDQALVALAGTGGGQLSRVDAASEALRKLLRANPGLRRIAEIAGRLKLSARQKQRTKATYVPEQVVDVTVGGEIARLVPAELAQLADVDTELLLMRRLVEKQALQYRLEGQERLDQGPVIFCVDGSGSMAGSRHEWAMGVALAMIEVCAIQRRPFCLVHFDHEVQQVFEVPKSGRIPGEKLLEMLSFFSNGGTSFAPPLDWAASKLGAQGESGWKDSDVVLVTDGCGDWGTSLGRVKELGAAVYGVAIESSFSEAQAAELSGVAEVSGNLEGAKVDLLLGI